MNAQDIINEIERISCNDPALLPLGNAMHQYTRQFQSGELSQDEYLELLKDLQIKHLIHIQCSDMAAKEQLNTICNAVIAAGRLLV